MKFKKIADASFNRKLHFMYNAVGGIFTNILVAIFKLSLCKEGIKFIKFYHVCVYEIRGVFRILSNILDGAFYEKSQ